MEAEPPTSQQQQQQQQQQEEEEKVHQDVQKSPPDDPKVSEIVTTTGSTNETSYLPVDPNDNVNSTTMTTGTGVDDKPISSSEESSSTLKEASSETVENNNDNKSESAVTTPETLEEQDKVVFGTINHDLADTLVGRLEVAIQTKVIDTLPLLQNNQEAKDRLNSVLRHKFVRNVDVLEAYCDHHVLTMRKHPIATRKRIVQVVELMMKKQEANKGGSSSSSDGGSSLTESSSEPDPIQLALNATAVIPVVDVATSVVDESISAAASFEEKFQHPTKDEIPTSEQRAEVDTDLENLQQKLVLAKERRNQLLVETARLAQAGTVATKATDVVLDSHPSAFYQQVSNLCSERISHGQSIGDLTAEAERSLERLDAIKRERPKYGQQDDDDIMLLSQRSQNDPAKDNDDKDDIDTTTDEFDPLSQEDDDQHLPIRPVKKRLSLEESYHRDKKQLGLKDTTNNKGLVATLNLLKPQRSRSVERGVGK